MTSQDSALYQRLYETVSALPVIDTHEHMLGPQGLISFEEPIQALLQGYVVDDLRSAGADNATIALLRDPSIPTQDKWTRFQDYWGRIQHTAYARVSRYVLEDHYSQTALTLDSLSQVAAQLGPREDAFFWRVFEQNQVRMILTDPLGFDVQHFPNFLTGRLQFDPRIKALIPLPLFHVIQHHGTSARNWAGVQRIGSWADRHITSLDQFLEAVFIVFQRAIERGAIGLKDQCAYNRSLDYEVVARADAERLFNRMLANPHALLGWPEAKPLDDFLFHQYMRFAAELELPVQIHTGHMAGSYNRVDKANAAQLATVLELHQDVRFDLFHGNWPYMGDILFLAKNYPNVALNLCWLFIIDPLYAQEMLKRAIMTVPYSKIHAFGGDYEDIPEFAAGHLRLAREVLSAALCDLIESGWLDEAQAVTVARAVLFDNPKRFFGLDA